MYVRGLVWMVLGAAYEDTNIAAYQDTHIISLCVHMYIHVYVVCVCVCSCKRERTKGR